MKRFLLRGRRTAAPFYRWLLIVLACAAAGMATACHRANEGAADIKVLTAVQPQPPRVGQATVAIAIADAHAGPVTGASIQVEGDMAHPGMAPVFHDAKAMAPGSYVAETDFTMPGDWVLLLHIRLADGRKIERQVDVRGVEEK
jgi:hypothetical protein